MPKVITLEVNFFYFFLISLIKCVIVFRINPEFRILDPLSIGSQPKNTD